MSWFDEQMAEAGRLHRRCEFKAWYSLVKLIEYSDDDGNPVLVKRDGFIEDCSFRTIELFGERRPNAQIRQRLFFNGVEYAPGEAIDTVVFKYGELVALDDPIPIPENMAMNASEAKPYSASPVSPTHLYRLYDQSCRLLYVGITSRSPQQRIGEHHSTKAWWPDVNDSLTTIRTYQTRDEAAKAERTAIRTECPRHNKSGVIR